ncbi:HTH-type transcriptional repressor DasR [Streptomyces sp. RB5]|uniref:HTH-type transcriptional repressor DasR n=1 Tax=Streptomyces smaragdinus TaxID=2585196 RepID=A0A7K0CC20_9ACTN|nr:GntR family transcriptional regulator [Streptomyces smaragdinus]MQY10652.1 HTH-type transcriptional repressor DasR [Streptomyces smaragdinus]
MGTTQLDAVQEPKYWHLKSVLSDALDSEFAVGEILPNERDLAARFGVARATLRQALDQLELEGRLQRRRGVGTTVAPPRIGVPVGSGQHTWPDEQELWEPVSVSLESAPAAIARMLGTDGGEKVHTVRRIRARGGQTVAAQLLYVPARSVPGVDGDDVAAARVVRELGRHDMAGQDRTVELGSARAEDARELDRLPGAPVLVVTTRYTDAGRTVAVSVDTYRADTCRLTFSDDGSLLAG